jgi:DNA repair exonuclease SbcCD ATPase subunit
MTARGSVHNEGQGMPDRDDLKVEVPFLGSANHDESEDNIVEKQQQLARKQYETKSSHWVHTLLILLLMGSVGAMAYWGYDFKQDQEQRELLAEATEARIADLEQLLAQSQEEAKKSGQTLQQRLDEQRKLVSEQKALMDEQYSQYEEKFAQLIENANNKQLEQLTAFNSEIGKIETKIKNAQEDAQEEMGFMTSQQKTALTSLEDRLAEIDGLRTSLTNIEISQTKTGGIQKEVAAEMKALADEIATFNTKLAKQESDLKAQTAAVETGLEQYKVNNHKSIKSLAAKVSVIARKAAPKLDAKVTKRLQGTENAIRAIDGSRAQVNKEIQRLKSKVNKIQLQLQ